VRNVFIHFKLVLLQKDRFYVQTASKRNLVDEAHFLFKESVFDVLKNTLRQIVLDKIRNDRNGEMADRSLLKSTLAIFVDMGMGDLDIYINEFEKFVEIETKDFYHKESEEWFSKYSLTEYLRKAEWRIKEETQLLNHVFTSYSRDKLMRICNEQLLAERQSLLLEMSGSGVEVLINQEKFDDLSLLYRLMGRIEHGLEPIAAILQNYITHLGVDIFDKYQSRASEIQDYSQYVKMLLEYYVPELLEIHMKMDIIVTEAFQLDAIFQKALSQGFKSFVNKRFKIPGSKSEIGATQLFAFYCDEIMKKKEEKLEEKMDKIVKFTQFFNDKDLFIEEYRKQLAKRLLSSSYQESDERSVIAKMKYRYRVGEVYKLEKMLTDKALAFDMKTDFDAFLAQKNISLPFDLNVTVLTMGTWPISIEQPIRLPNFLADAQAIFKEFYDSRNNRRMLKWAHTKSYIQLDARFASDKKLLEVSTYQACILLMFNDFHTLSLNQLGEETGIDMENLQKTVMSLVRSGCKLLIMESGDKNLARQLKPTGDSTFSVNENFKHKLYKIKVPNVRLLEEDIQSSQISINDDRIGILDAAIVRIMKARKISKITSLINETINQVIDRFKPETREIKRRIESLIEREYLTRTEDNNSIQYLA
jgi:hypothetical protein